MLYCEINSYKSLAARPKELLKQNPLRSSLYRFVKDPEPALQKQHQTHSSEFWRGFEPIFISTKEEIEFLVIIHRIMQSQFFSTEILGEKKE